MIRTLTPARGLLILWAAMGCAGTASYAGSVGVSNDSASVGVRADSRRERDERATLEGRPAAVRRTVTARPAGGSILELERTTDRREVLCEVDVRDVDGVFAFDVAEDGTFHGFDEDHEDHWDGGFDD